MEPKLPITRSAEGYPERVNEFLRRVSMVMFKDVKWIVVVVCVCVCVCSTSRIHFRISQPCVTGINQNTAIGQDMQNITPEANMFVQVTSS